MIAVTVVTGTPEVQVSFNGNTFYFPTATSKADYSDKGDTIILQCPPIGLSIPFPSASYQFTIDTVAWVGTFASLAETFNKTYFNNVAVSPDPTPESVIRANTITTGAYVNTSSILVTGREQVHFDFNITNGGTLANPGAIVAIVQVSDNDTTWHDLYNLAPATALASDGATTPYSAGAYFRQFTGEIGAVTIPYESSSLPPREIRVSYSTGYGKYYRLSVRASSGGISTGAPATFPNLRIRASLQ
jgi:hypothetical protein